MRSRMHHGRDAFLHPLAAIIHLAGADHLTVRGLQVEVVLATGRDSAFVIGDIRRVPPNALDTLHAGRMHRIASAAQDHFAVRGYKVEALLPARIGFDVEFAVAHGLRRSPE